MKQNAYKLLFLRKEEIEELDRINEEKANQKIREKAIKMRILEYGNPDNPVDDFRINPKNTMKSIEAFEMMAKAIEKDIEILLAYDAISSKEKREIYNKKLESRPTNNTNISFLEIDPIQLEASRKVNAISLLESKIKLGNVDTNAYSVFGILKPEEENFSVEESLRIDKKIQLRYIALMEEYEKEIRAGIIKTLNTGEFNCEKEINRAIMQLKLKWAFDKIKDRKSREEYDADIEYNIDGQQNEKLKKYSKKSFVEKIHKNHIKYVIDWDNEEFYLRHISSKAEEIQALRSGKQVIYCSKDIGYKNVFGAILNMEEYVVESVENNELKEDKILTENLRIIDITKSNPRERVIDRQYSNYTLGKLFSAKSIKGCIKYRFGYIGRTEKDKNGMYMQYFDEETMQAAKEYSEMSKIKGE